MYSNSTDIEKRYPCYETYASNKVACVGGVGTNGTKSGACPLATSCSNVAAAKHSALLRPTYLVKGAANPHPGAGASSPHALPVGVPVSSSPAAPPAQPVRYEQPPPAHMHHMQHREHVYAGREGVVPSGAMAPVTYDAVAPHVGSRLPVSEHRRHSKKSRFAAEVIRAGLVGGAQQAAHFFANVPFLNDDD